MADENIQGAAVAQPVQEQTGDHAERPGIRLLRGVLVRPIGAVAHGTAKAADQNTMVADRFQVQVRAALSFGPSVGGVEIRVVIPRHIKHGYIQHSDQKFEVRIGQVAAPKDQANIAEMSVRCQ